MTLEGFMTDLHSVQNPGSVSSYFCRFLQPINMLLSIQQSMMFYANHWVWHPKTENVHCYHHILTSCHPPHFCFRHQTSAMIEKNTIWIKFSFNGIILSQGKILQALKQGSLKSKKKHIKDNYVYLFCFVFLNNKFQQSQLSNHVLFL